MMEVKSNLTSWTKMAWLTRPKSYVDIVHILRATSVDKDLYINSFDA